MKKHLLAVEFRYDDKQPDKDSSDYRNNTVTIGIYDTIEEAITEGNKVLDVLFERFEYKDKGDKFELNHLWGFPKRLVVVHRLGVQFFAKIDYLNFDNVSEAAENAIKAAKRYKKYRKELND